MSTKSAVTAKNFSSKVSAFVKAATTQRDNMQELIQFAAEHYNGHQDPVFFNKALDAAVQVRSMASRTLQAYIQEHTNLQWAGAKDGQPKFRKIKGTEHKCDLSVFSSTKWYLHSDVGQAKADWKADSYAKRVASKLISEGVSVADFAKLLKEAEKVAKDNGAKAKRKEVTAK